MDPAATAAPERGERTSAIERLRSRSSVSAAVGVTNARLALRLTLSWADDAMAKLLAAADDPVPIVDFGLTPARLAGA